MWSYHTACVRDTKAIAISYYAIIIMIITIMIIMIFHNVISYQAIISNIISNIKYIDT